ncbi:unnamed protein product [Penicillium salamii]|uniref:Nephrocystin 3-like N-terminal domain-containing protein n=1 Tax=Penicillium salamii TaxID=1612424 RepID=A0A9W4J394_9EURO|nr:unnamed protein product [Penicillium salamii]
MYGVSFTGENYGNQTGVNHGTINMYSNAAGPLDQLPVADGAEFDSFMDRDEVECLSGTRTELLEEIADWMASPDGKPIFWLNGMAGTGKSTISRTVARRLKNENTLGASFFFRLGEGDRGNTRKLFPTLARQLARSVPGLAPRIQKAVQTNPDIATRRIDDQFDKLILRPLLSLDTLCAPIPTMVILIDALDECDSTKDMQNVIRLLPHLQSSSALRLRVLLTSRPEMPIRLGFKKSQDHRDLILHEIPPDIIARDLALFFNHRILEIREERDPPLPFDWPGEVNIQRLVDLSIPLFIFAATICRIFEEPDWDPLDSLPQILAHQKDESKLDSTYLPVLGRILQRQNPGSQRDDLIREFHQVVGSIVMLETPLSIASLSRLLGIPERQIQLRLNSLHSVLRVPNDESLPVQIFHLSFRDFLLDPATQNKTPLWVEKFAAHHRLATRCLLVLSEQLQRNICKLPNEGFHRQDISPQTLDDYISPEMQYSCRYWAFHLTQCMDSQNLMDNALSFFEKSFLHWVEAMCLLGHASEVLGIINLLQTTPAGSNTSKALILDKEFLRDAKRFIFKIRHIIDHAPLQVYCAGLVFAPERSRVRKQFTSDPPRWISGLSPAREEWGSMIQTFEGHLKPVSCVVFSPDNILVASCSEDHTIKLWNTTTGTLQHTMDTPFESRHSMAFSNDGGLLACGYNNGEVWLWDTATNELKRIIKCHYRSLSSVAFSSDKLLATGAEDGTVKIWDVETACLKITLRHPCSVHSLVFSPNNRLLATGSKDGSVRLWSIMTSVVHENVDGFITDFWSELFSLRDELPSRPCEKMIQLLASPTNGLQWNLHGHSEPIVAMVFLSDDELLSCSNGGIVHQWNIRTGTLTHKFEANLDSMNSVALSHHGFLASGSNDGTVSLWNIKTGTLLQTFEAHPASVNSVTFSPDGQLASGSNDTTVQLCDTSTGFEKSMLVANPDPIALMRFSPDSRLLLSVSQCGLLQLWDTVTFSGKTLEGRFSNETSSVKFSHDGQMLAVFSEPGNQLHIWDTLNHVQIYSGNLGHWHVRSLTFSSNGHVFSWVSNYQMPYSDPSVWLLDITKDQPQETLIGSGLSPVEAVSPDGRFMAITTNAIPGIKIWDIANGVWQSHASRIRDRPYKMVFAPNSQVLACAHEYSSILRLWDLTTDTVQNIHSFPSWVTEIVFSPDGRSVASVGNRIGVYDVETDKLQAQMVAEVPNALLKFPKDNPHLIAYSESHIFKARFPLRGISPYAYGTDWRDMSSSEISLCNNWIWFDHEKVLRLPPEARASALAVETNKFAIGYESGRVQFMEFRSP